MDKCSIFDYLITPPRREKLSKAPLLRLLTFWRGYKSDFQLSEDSLFKSNNFYYLKYNYLNKMNILLILTIVLSAQALPHRSRSKKEGCPKFHVCIDQRTQQLLACTCLCAKVSDTPERIVKIPPKISDVGTCFWKLVWFVSILHTLHNCFSIV